MKWEMVRLGDVFTKIRNGASIKQNKNISRNAHFSNKCVQSS